MQPQIRERAKGVRERRGPAAHASRAVAFLKGPGKGWVVAVIAGLFLGVSGPFGSIAAPLPSRLAFWLGLMLAGAAMGSVVSRAMHRRGHFERRPWLASVALTLVLAAPMSVVVWLALGLIYPIPPTLQSYLRVLPSVLIVGAAMVALNMVVHRRPNPPAAAAAPATVRFLERLPLKLRGADLYAVEAEDHYLRLHTSKGSDLILMRLADAVAELEGLDGAQTHRSWWVAKAAVRDARTGDGRAVLTLANGVEAPVSRRYAAALRRAGWW